MSNFRVIMTLLVVYMFIGSFGGNYGLNTSIARDILDIDKPVEKSLFSVATSFIDFIFSLVLLPLLIITSKQNPIVIIIIEFLSLAFYVELAVYIRGNN